MTYVRTQYKPAELLGVLDILQSNAYHAFALSEAIAIVELLRRVGYRIVKTGEQE